MEAKSGPMDGSISSRNQSAVRGRARRRLTTKAGDLYGVGGNGEFRCLAADSGRVIWRRNILVENHGEVLTYGDEPRRRLSSRTK